MKEYILASISVGTLTSLGALSFTLGLPDCQTAFWLKPFFETLLIGSSSLSVVGGILLLLCLIVYLESHVDNKSARWRFTASLFTWWVVAALAALVSNTAYVPLARVDELCVGIIRQTIQEQDR